MIAVLATACGDTPKSRCDQAALAAAATEAEAAMTSWSPREGRPPDYRAAVQGLRPACPTLPKGFHGYLEHSMFPRPDVRSFELDMGTPLHKDDEGLAPLRRRCPGLARTLAAVSEAPAEERVALLYDGCALDGLGVLARDELSLAVGEAQARYGHALYLWLRDDGAPHEVARALVRPMVAGTDDSLELPAFTKLPAAERGDPVSLADESPLQVTQIGVTFLDRRVVELDGGSLSAQDVDGGIVHGLHDALTEELDTRQHVAARRGEVAATRLSLVVDAGLPWRTAGPLVWTAARSGFDTLVLRALVPDPMRPVRTLPLLTPGSPPAAELRLTGEAATIRCDEQEPRPVALTAVADAVAGCGGTGLRLVADAEVPWQRVVDLAAAIAGRAAIVEVAPP